MNTISLLLRRFSLGILIACALCAGMAVAAPLEPVFGLARQEQKTYLETLKRLVEIESGSRDREGLDAISQVIGDQLKALGGQVEFIEPPEEVNRGLAPAERIGRVVHARFQGSGSKKILLIGHMDTVYQRGMLAKSPFRIERDRAYGLGINDDKQGVALIIHALSLLRQTNFNDYGLVTVLINADEEIGSRGSRHLITKFGAEHDATLSLEPAPASSDKLSLATAGIGSVTLSVTGKASHAGSSPEKGLNALYEMAHQVLQMKDFSDQSVGVKMNWTVAKSGEVRNVIPADAMAYADVRVLRVSDYDLLEPKVRERVKNQLIQDTKVEVKFTRGRPPLEMTPASEALAKHAQGIYAELDKKLIIGDKASGGGTDAAYAALKTKAPVIESLGVQGTGSHTADLEHILIESIVPRLYLLTRMIMDISQGKTQ